jgi:hypothetical protein
MAGTPSKVPAELVPDLIIAQRLLTEGTDAVARADHVSVRLGVVVTDLAAEYMLKLVLRQAGKAIDPNSKFPRLVEAVIATSEEAAFGYVSGLMPLRNSRNCVMHDGTAQEPQAARALVAGARVILIRLTSDALGVDLANLRLADFVTPKRLRYALREAEKRYDAGAFFEAAGIAVCAYDQIMARWTKFGAWLAPHRTAKDTPTDPLITAVSAGVHIPDLRRSREATENVSASMSVSGRLSSLDFGWSARRSVEEQRDAARLAVEFVTGLALQIEGRIVGHAERSDPYDDALPEA